MLDVSIKTKSIMMKTFALCCIYRYGLSAIGTTRRRSAVSRKPMASTGLIWGGDFSLSNMVLTY